MKERPTCSGRATACAVPPRTPRISDVDDATVDVVAPGGRLRKAQTAPTVSASVISAPPCITKPAVQRSGDQASRPVTSSGAGPVDLDPGGDGERHHGQQVGRVHIGHGAGLATGRSRARGRRTHRRPRRPGESARRCAPTSTSTARPWRSSAPGSPTTTCAAGRRRRRLTPARPRAAHGRGGARLVPPGHRRPGRAAGVVAGRRLPGRLRRGRRRPSPRRSRPGRPRSRTPAGSRPPRSPSTWSGSTAGRGDEYSLRRILIHLVQEYARHNGHADLIREGIDGATGV